MVEVMPLPIRKANPDEIAVRIELATVDGGTLLATCVIVHDGTEILDVRLPCDWRALASAAGIPSHCSAFEGYLEVLARFAFSRGAR
jgi:hypothetical protein